MSDGHGLSSWTDYVGDLDVNAIYDLGNQWIEMGDSLYAEQLNFTDEIGALAWKGDAFATAQDVWVNQMSVVLNDAADAAWKTGEAINAYADNIKKEAEKMAKDDNTAFFAQIFGFVLTIVALPVGAALGAAASVLARVLSSLVSVLSQIAERLGPVAMTALEFTAGAAAGAAASFVFDMADLGLASAAAHNDFTINGTSEGINIGLGAALGGILATNFGRLSNPGFRGGAGHLPGTPPMPKPGPHGTAPSNPSSAGNPHANNSRIPESVTPHDVSLNAGDARGNAPAGGGSIADSHPTPTTSTPETASAGERLTSSGPHSGAEARPTSHPPAVAGPHGAPAIAPPRPGEVLGGHSQAAENAPPPAPGVPRPGGPVDVRPPGPTGSSGGPAKPGPTANGEGPVAQPKGAGNGYGDPTAAPSDTGRDGTVPPSNLEKEPASPTTSGSARPPTAGDVRPSGGESGHQEIPPASAHNGPSGLRSGPAESPETPITSAPTAGHDQSAPALNGGRDNLTPAGRGNEHQDAPTTSGPTSTHPGGQAPKTGGVQDSTGSPGSPNESAVVNRPEPQAAPTPPPSNPGHVMPGAEAPRTGAPGEGGASAPVSHPQAQRPTGGPSPDTNLSKTPSGHQAQPDSTPGGQQGKAGVSGGEQGAPPESLRPSTSGDRGPSSGASGHQEAPTSSAPAATPPGGQAPKTGGAQGSPGSRGPGDETAVVNRTEPQAQPTPPPSDPGHVVPGAEVPPTGIPGGDRPSSSTGGEQSKPTIVGDKPTGSSTSSGFQGVGRRLGAGNPESENIPGVSGHERRDQVSKQVERLNEDGAPPFTVKPESKAVGDPSTSSGKSSAGSPTSSDSQGVGRRLGSGNPESENIPGVSGHERRDQISKQVQRLNEDGTPPFTAKPRSKTVGDPSTSSGKSSGYEGVDRRLGPGNPESENIPGVSGHERRDQISKQVQRLNEDGTPPFTA
ncbi:hypothetical protein AB0L00_39625, partial [Actinoallomurus sp. NPDC052308]